MTETEFLAIAESVLDAIENAFERAGEEADVDVECSRSGNVLEIEFVDNGSQIIVNTQAPMREIWVAARPGGADAVAELHFGFLGVPQMSLQARMGVNAALALSGGNALFALGTTPGQGANVWDVVTGSLSATYYFGR